MSKFRGFIGTYTNGDSKGIYSFVLDTEAEEITDVKVAAELGNPTYLNISEDRQYLYSVIKEAENGGVAAFSIKSGELQLINSEVSPGSPPCHVSIDSKQRFVFSTNYHKGTVDSYLIQDGAISSPVSVIQHEGSGPDPRQEKAHTHYAGMTPDGEYLAVVELGCDLLLTYRVNEDGTLTEVNRLKLRPGSGPRHLEFHPLNPSIAYLMTEFSSEVIVLTYENGTFDQIQSISTIPSDFVENNQGSAIHVSSDGKFVYAANRGHNSIAVFAVNQENGQIKLVEIVSTEGDWPRDFVLDPTNQFLLASNQNSSNLVLYKRDAETGKLTPLQKDISVPNPVCLKF
ncbi:6-phosphogluconolactonase [Bacillus sp. FJAT-27225]|nr:6-phosphogluconolactonase [Bacillus sp. FJAT-27225]